MREISSRYSGGPSIPAESVSLQLSCMTVTHSHCYTTFSSSFQVCDRAEVRAAGCAPPWEPAWRCGITVVPRAGRQLSSASRETVSKGTQVIKQSTALPTQSSCLPLISVAYITQRSGHALSGQARSFKASPAAERAKAAILPFLFMAYILLKSPKH